MANQTVSRRFICSATAVGVGANYNGQRRFWASRALPKIGGVDPARGEPGPTGDPVLNFTRAETQISGTETSAGVYDTVVRATVEGLNILNGAISAQRVSVTVKWRCDLNTPNANRSIAITGADNTQNPFVNLRINGRAVNVDLDAPAALPAGPSTADDTLADLAARDYPVFRAQLPLNRPLPQPQRRAGRHITHPPRAGGAAAPFHKAFTHLIRLPNAQIDGIAGGPPYEFGVYNGPLPVGMERVYLCEWSADPIRQCLTIMRVKLTAPKGEIVICDLDPNGDDFP